MSNYFLQTSRASRARKRCAIKWATLVSNRADVLRADRLDRTLDLVDVLTEISVEVTVVVAEVRPLQFAHSKLRGETEGAFTDVLLGNQTFESLASDDEGDLIRRGDPSRIAALTKTVGDRGLIDRVDHVYDTCGRLDDVEAQRLLIDTERESAVAHELITTDGLLTESEGSSGQVQEVFLDVCVVTDVFNSVGASKNLEVLTFLGGERLGEHLFTEERTDAVQSLEVKSTVGVDTVGGSLEQCVDLLHVPGKVRGERLSAVHDVLDTGLDKVLIPDVSVDQLEDGLLKRDLSLKVAALECGASLLDANTGACTTQGSKLELVLGRTNDVRSSTNTAEVEICDEVWRCK